MNVLKNYELIAPTVATEWRVITTTATHQKSLPLFRHFNLLTNYFESEH
jgi:hypothetical protein